jgi:Domain of unknown function (DUF4383)
VPGAPSSSPPPDHPAKSPETRARRYTLQKADLAVGAVFLLVGVLGFIPGVTASYVALGAAGHESGALLLGVFQVSVLHNIVHLLFGVAGLMPRSSSLAKNYLLFGGIISLVLWIYGLLVGHDSPANFVPVNNADNWLHLVLGIGMIACPVAVPRHRQDDGPSALTCREEPYLSQVLGYRR